MIPLFLSPGTDVESGLTIDRPRGKGDARSKYSLIEFAYRLSAFWNQVRKTFPRARRKAFIKGATIVEWNRHIRKQPGISNQPGPKLV